ncbi:cation diffusion facilitator family transporter [Solimonas soli]|uniref:cation diffusion facilitator family transporter n=1 Tax=Solimonas soli TaxID=413479 RepID=UPI0004B42E8C|nr:cation diffusion facilitator family transporter [Solimonas soli]
MNRAATEPATRASARAAPGGAKPVVYAALAGNLAIALTKFVAAGLSGSSAMLSEGVHSLVDTGNELLLLYGMRRARQPPDRLHPLGHARELYFWTFIVALLIFALGAGVSVYEGISQLRHPQPLADARAAYAVLAISFVFEAVSWWFALREFRRAKGRFGYLQAVRDSKDPSTFTVLFEDSAALLGLLLALAGVALSHALAMPVFDGLASLCIGALLGATALFLARESKGLLVGEAAHPQLDEALRRIAAQTPGIVRVNGVLTTQLGPEQVVGALSAEFHDTLRTPDIEACVDHIESRVREHHPEVLMLFVKPQRPEVWRARHDARLGGDDQGGNTHA